MPQKLLIGNFSQGLRTDREPFVISNDSFPQLENAYIWRGRIIRKGGTETLGRLLREFPISQPFTLSTQANGATYDNADILADANVVSGGATIRSTQPGAEILPGSVNITVGAVTFADDAQGSLAGNPIANTGTINYATGALHLDFDPPLGAPTNVVIYFSYYPVLPVLGLEDFETDEINFPTLVAFDRRYSYQFDQSTSFFYDTSFFKNSHQRVVWKGQDWQQFWSTNYSASFWALNNNPGFHFLSVDTYVAGTPTTVNTAVNHGLITGDYVWFNEVQGASASALNGLTFQVTVTSPTQFTVPPTTAALTNATGIFETLTSMSPTANGDGIRWYDGDPVNDATKGWVNFAPPLSEFDASLNPNPEYLIGALAVLPFKDRLLFFSPTISTSGGVTRTIQDGVVFSWNGTPYYSSLVPTNWPTDGYDVSSWYAPPAGSAGDARAGISQQIVTVTNNEDVLLIGFENRQVKLIYTQNNYTPFLFYSINSQMGSEGTFSGITLDEGAFTIGTYGIIATNQYETKRIDLQIPDKVFDISGENHGVERICSIRDFYNELIYWTYPTEGQNFGSDDSVGPYFPNQTLVYNYRDQTWAIFTETFTTYGNFRYDNSLIWDNVTWTWDQWTDSWDSGRDIARFPEIIAGNAQGYVLIKNAQNDGKSGEDFSGTIQNIVGRTVTSRFHTLASGDFIWIDDAIGTSGVNELLWKISVVDEHTFTLLNPITDPTRDDPSGTYLGGASFIRILNFFIQTKQFPAFWEEGRKVRIGTQRYLVERTNTGECTVGIYLSQDSSTPFNFNPPNSGVIFNSTLFTFTEDIQFPIPGQQQFWQNLPTSLIGDTVQLSFSLSEEQMSDLDLTIQNSPFTLHAIQIELYPGPILAQ